MQHYDVIIIGGGPAGFQAALSARKSNPKVSIALIRKEKKALIPCGIPYVLHSLKSVDDDILPDEPLQKHKIDIIIGEVSRREDHTLQLSDKRQISFKKLVLATGSRPVFPSIPGVEKEGVFFVKKEYDYLIKLQGAARSSKNILVIGGGYIGVEIADELLRAGKHVTLIEMLPSLLATTMDPEFSSDLHAELENHGAKIILGCKVIQFTGKDQFDGADLDNGDHIEADMAILSVGYKPNLEIAVTFGLETEKNYGIIVDEYLRTSDPDILAAGDCALHKNSITGKASRVMLASTAMAQGRLVGSNLFRISFVKNFQGTLGSFATKVGNFSFGVSGLTELEAKELGIHYFTGEHDSVDRHPGKLPGATKIHIKLLFARYSHVLLGAQIRGGDSVGELVNMISVMIQKRMTDMEIDTIQIGTHPLLTSSPIAYPVINATSNAIEKWFHKTTEEL
ncbi:MAG: FAD-dependent oxidoreductase [Candidatus Electryonea clarkiae]|nr:FAD-dependent oxidoreductase [Candidatus Electryonea clarkiae]